MRICENSLDDLMRSSIDYVRGNGYENCSTRGKSTEVVGTLMELSNPRSRLSRTESKGTLFSCVGELLWYLSGSRSLDVIRYYLDRYAENSDDGITVYGAYGPRLFGGEKSQFDIVHEILRSKPTSRQAVLQIFNANDLRAETKDVPCTCTLQFLLRNEKLHLITSMRSNDLYIGMPHDVFSFTMLQEIMAANLGVELGEYKHFVGSLHLYEDCEDKVNNFLKEGWNEDCSMPDMPKGNQTNNIQIVLECEEAIRNGEEIDEEKIEVDDYWKDIIRILIFYRVFKERNKRLIDQAEMIGNKIQNKVYKQYTNKYLQKIREFSEE